jgi:hypothetical protein
MAKRKNKLLLSDLFPELAAEREVAEEEREREEEEPARKVRKVDSRGRDYSKKAAQNEEKWNARLDVCKEWKRTKGRFPKVNRKDKEETSLYNWLRKCGPGGRDWTQARWEKLNEAFGEGWEKECFPCLETGGVFQPGNQIRNSANSRDETHWDAILEAVKLFKRNHGRFPRGRGGDADETRLYKWLQGNMDTTSTYYTHERANKLVLAFGDRWQSECFPKSIWAW